MTPSPDYDVLEGLAKAATPGPWQNGIEDLEGVVAPQQPGLGNVICVPPTDEMYSSYEHWQDNAAFIAAANPTTILALIAKARAGEAAVEALERIATVDYGGGFLGAEACRKVARTALSRIREGEQ